MESCSEGVIFLYTSSPSKPSLSPTLPPSKQDACGKTRIRLKGMIVSRLGEIGTRKAAGRTASVPATIGSSVGGRCVVPGLGCDLHFPIINHEE